MQNFKVTHFFQKKTLGILIACLGIGTIVLITGVAHAQQVLGNIQVVSPIGITSPEAGKAGIIVAPYSIAKTFLAGDYIYFVNPHSYTGYIPTTKGGVTASFNCNNTNNIGQALVSSQKWTQVRTTLDTTSYSRASSESGTWIQMAQFPDTLSSNQTLKTSIQTIAGDGTPGLAIACGCGNPDPNKILVQNGGTDPDSFPPYRQETFRTTPNAGDAGCLSQVRTCNASTGSFDGSTTYQYRGACLSVTPVTGSCVLKEFLRGVMSGQITYTKVRAAMTGQSFGNTYNTLPYSYGYPLGYGELMGGVYYGAASLLTPYPAGSIVYKNGSGTGPYVAIFSPQITFHGPTYAGTWSTVGNQFSLRGISPNTEGITRGCLDNTGYRVNSNVYSSQLVNHNQYAWYPGNFSGFTLYRPTSGIDFSNKRIRTRPGHSDAYSRIDLYGCQAELLPNPDAYCVEKVTNPDTSGSIFFKEFTKGYTGSVSCSAINLPTTTGATWSLLTKEDMGYNISPRDTSHIIFATTWYLSGIGGGESTLMNGMIRQIPRGYAQRGNPIYHYDSSPLYKPGTAIFGILLYNLADNELASYTFGNNSSSNVHGVKIPLQNGYYLYEVEGIHDANWTYRARASDEFSIVAQNATQAWSGICLKAGLYDGDPNMSLCKTQIMGTSISTEANFITKNVCSATVSSQAPGGSSVPNGWSATYFSSPAAPAGQTCSQIAQQRTAIDGVLNGSYTQTSCTDNTACVNPATSDIGVSIGGGKAMRRGTLYNPSPLGTLPNGWVGVFYDVNSVGVGESCSTHAQTRQCTNGVLNGGSTYQYATCTQQPGRAPTFCSAGYTMTAQGCVLSCATNQCPSGYQCSTIGAQQLCTTLSNVTYQSRSAQSPANGTNILDANTKSLGGQSACQATLGCARTSNSQGGSCQCSALVNIIGTTNSFLISQMNGLQVILSGQNPIERPVNTPYIDAGYTLSGGVGIIDITGSVNTDVVGNNYVFFTPIDTNGSAGITTIRNVQVVDTIPPTLTLNEGLIIREIGNKFLDHSYTLSDNYWGVSNISVEKTGNLNTGALGTYKVLYTPVDKSGNRGVGKAAFIKLVDTTPPTITLNGPSSVNVIQSKPYTDAGATVSDNYRSGQDISLSVSGEVNTNVIGQSIIQYTATDASNNTSQTTRIVNVVPQANIFTLSGTFYMTLDGKYRYIRYITEGVKGSTNIVNTIIDQTPTFSDIKSLATYLGTTYGLFNNYKTIADRNTLPLVDTNVYKTIIGDGYGRYLLATYTIDGSNQAKIINTSPAFANIGDLYYFLEQSEAINFNNGQTTYPTEIFLTTKTSLKLSDIMHPVFQQLCLENGAYTIANYAVDFKNNYRKLIDFANEFNTASDLMIYFTHLIGNDNYPIPKVRQNTSAWGIQAASTNMTISLLGDSPMEIEVNTPFTDPGYTTQNASDVIITSDLDITQPGSYTITYIPIGTKEEKGTPTNRIVDVVDTTAPTISLAGGEIIVQQLNMPFNISDQYIVQDNYSDPSQIIVNTVGSVDTATVGSYTLTYTATDEAGNTSAPIEQTIYIIDTTPPTITLDGANPLTLTVGDSFTEPGYTITDNYPTQGAILDNSTHSIVQSDKIDTNTPGTYQVDYLARDNNGNFSNWISRNVIVQAQTTNATILGSYYTSEDKSQFGYVRYVEGTNQRINSTPLFSTIEEVQAYLEQVYGMHEKVASLPTLKELGITQESISKDIISDKDGTIFMQVVYSTDLQGNRSLISTGKESFPDPNVLIDYLRNQESLTYTLPSIRPTLQTLNISTQVQTQELSGTFYRTDDLSAFGRIDYILDQNGERRVIYKTPQFSDPVEVINYLKNLYGRTVEVPKKGIQTRSELQKNTSIRDTNIYSEVLVDDFGGYIEVVYSLGTKGGGEYRKAINVSPSFKTAAELINFLENSEGITYSQPAIRNTMLQVNIDPNNAKGSTYVQPVIENGEYTLAYYIVDTEKNGHYLIGFDKATFKTPAEVIGYLDKDLGISYLLPKTWYTVDQLDMIRL